MAIRGVTAEVMSASRVFLLDPVTVNGVNRYIIGTDSITWDDANSYAISQIAPTFGKAVLNHEGTTAFACGESSISVFDFGLLLSCFTLMSAAQIELGESVPTEEVDTRISGLYGVWFGNAGLIYSRTGNLMIQIPSSAVQRACKRESVRLPCFVDSREFVLTRQEGLLVIDTTNGEGVCQFPVPTFIRRSFPTLFGLEKVKLVDDPTTPWDETSPLGAVINSMTIANNATETVKKYRSQTNIDSIVVRSDLICTPHMRYKDASDFLGSLCYTDRQDIALAVNLRNNLFIYRPWFDGGDPSEERLSVIASPKLSEFYNVNDECERIMQYATTVTHKAPTPAELDYLMFSRIKDAFYAMELPRLAFASTFGKIVIPEAILVPGLDSQAGENIYCIIPVGCIGANVIVINSRGHVEAIKGMPWTTDEYFYDVTEVVREIQ